MLRKNFEALAKLAYEIHDPNLNWTDASPADQEHWRRIVKNVLIGAGVGIAERRRDGRPVID